MIKEIWNTEERIAEDKELFENVGFVVETSCSSKFFLWKENKDAPEKYKVDWQEISLGYNITLGLIDDRPVCVSVHYAILKAFREVKVMFCEGSSQIVDHKMIDNWLRHHTLETVRWDNGKRWAHTNAMNFHHCIHHVQGR